MTNSPVELPENSPETPIVMPPEYYVNSALKEIQQACSILIEMGADGSLLFELSIAEIRLRNALEILK